MAKSKVTAGTIGRFVHQKAMEKLTNGDGDYWQCFHQVLDEDDELKALYIGITKTTHGPEIKPTPSSSQSAGAELDRLTRQSMFETNTTDYEWSLRQILKANPGLAKKYTQT